ncbi:sugar phosphate isomerase/epimerase family protein [Paenibacillus sp. FSL H3-0469]|uniref:sugar phosphate isomerase/epimerase family protein n=1 Tax=Paenibacillus sp. FSL H3-0469 TaxID=2954506 RepID=UPI0031014EF6
MNLSISNIAWDSKEDISVIALLNELGVKGIEVAPTKIWTNPLDVSDIEAEKVREDWAHKGIELVAMQSLLFGRSHLNLFSKEVREEMLKYLTGIIQLSGKMGIKSLVFGSPKNRLAGELSKKEQFEIAIPFFNDLGAEATKNNVVFCIEPNPVQYGCDFITNTSDAVSLVREVANPSFKLHLDSGALILNEENIFAAIEEGFPYLNHFHISEPYLNLIGLNPTSHVKIAHALKTLGYSNWVSIEMKDNLLNNNVESVEKALSYAMAIYN